MRILVVGGGGREHALCWAISASPLCTKLYCAPGNAGIAQVAECIDVAAEDIAGQVALAVVQKIDFVVVGPEVPLAAGLADRIAEAGIKVFGPSAQAARLESSKGFTKELCRRHNIPTGAYERFTDADKAVAYIKAEGAPIVVKADGLAAGKGVVVAETVEQAIEAVRDMLSGNRFGTAGASVVIEEFLVGEEASFFALCDGEHALPLVGAQDHKRAFDGDKGPNTGGMGAYSPAPVFDAAMQKRTMDEIILPTVRAMAEAGTPFKGVLYAGLMIGAQGPKIFEYNCRFGDPECQAILPLLDQDVLPLFEAVAQGRGLPARIRWRAESSVCVVLASHGYPGTTRAGDEITGLDADGGLPGVNVFQAGTAERDRRLVTAGGRVLGVQALGADIRSAIAAAYAGVNRIRFDGMQFRRDIGQRAVNRA